MLKELFPGSTDLIYKGYFQNTQNIKTFFGCAISVSELTPPPNFSLIPLKIKKLDFDPQKQRMT